MLAFLHFNPQHFFRRRPAEWDSSRHIVIKISWRYAQGAETQFY